MGKNIKKYAFSVLFIMVLLLESKASGYNDALVIPADRNGMEHTAMQLASLMRVGWNLGNSLEAYGNDPTSSEMSWGNPMTTKAMIDSVAKAGFNAIRIPIRWYPHFAERPDGTIKIDSAWVQRVKQLVDWSRENDMYVIINTHHEKWLESHALYKDSAEVYRKERALWTEIAISFRDYDEHLLFAGTNEVHMSDNWGRPEQENVDVQNGFNQVFIDAVRATGGRNTYRTLIVQTYVTNYEFGPELFRFPIDSTPGRMMVEMHFYDPWNYCGLGTDKYWGKTCNSFGIDGEAQEARLKSCLASLKTIFSDRGYPIIIGECGVVRHEVAPEEDKSVIELARGYYLEMMVSECRKNGAIPFLWDNGAAIGGGQEKFGLFDRKAGMKQVDYIAIPAIMRGAQTPYLSCFR